MDAPHVPPPVVGTMHGSTACLEQRREVPDALLALQRREEQLQQHLQILLDAQADGLLAGLGHGVPDDQTSNGSSTPTVQSVHTSSKSPARKPTRRKIGLQSARRGIRRTIEELGAIKIEESRLLDSDLEENEGILAQIDTWGKKREGLSQKIEDIEHVSGQDRAGELRQEAEHLKQEIDDMEVRLSQMKVRHRKLISEISSIENSVQSKLSSYKAALSILDSQIESFLIRPPTSSNGSSTSTSIFLALPKNRRTLEMAKDHWQNEHEELMEKKQRADVEREAAENGAQIWREIVDDVTTFEKLLRREMLVTGSSSNQSNRVATMPSLGIEGLISRMGEIVQRIGERQKLAEGNGWNLLVCCIGAELQAFLQGRDILQNALEASSSQRLDVNQGSKDEVTQPSRDNEEREPRDGTRAFKPSLYSRDHSIDTSDDEPDPELLVSHQDTDTD